MRHTTFERSTHNMLGKGKTNQTAHVKGIHTDRTEWKNEPERENRYS